jgi:ArsR family transcriptional regulator, virulence genes transcriptional regulator
MASQYNIELYRMKAELCKTFADPTRLMIISELLTGEKVVGNLVETLGLPQPLVSRHLAVLRERGIVVSRREGASVYYRLSDPKIVEACDLVHNILLNQIANNRKFADSLIVPHKLH